MFLSFEIPIKGIKNGSIWHGGEGKSPGKNTGVGCLFSTQGSNPGLLHWQADSLPLSHLRSLSPT